MKTELQRVWREEIAIKRQKQPSDERVVGVAVDMIKEYGFNLALDLAHRRMADTDTALHSHRPLKFGQTFWKRVITELHARRI